MSATETVTIQGVTIIMNETALGVMGAADDRTMVRRTTDGRFAVLPLRANRVIKVFDDPWRARQYNAAIHGERL